MSLSGVARDLLGRMVWRARSLTWEMRSGVRVELRSYAEWVVYNDIFVDGEYDWALERVLAGKRERTFVVDLGANVGLFAWRTIDRSEGRGIKVDLLMVEASRRLVRRLEEDMSRAPASATIRIVRGLVGERGGSGILKESAFHVSNRVVATGGAGNTVPYINMSELIPMGRRIDLLKCDIEGSELRFVETYPDLLMMVDCAVFEFHPKLCNVEACRDLILASGLKNHRVERHGEDISVEVFWRYEAGVTPLKRP